MGELAASHTRVDASLSVTAVVEAVGGQMHLAVLVARLAHRGGGDGGTTLACRATSPHDPPAFFQTWEYRRATR